jgi:hypothetical protein
VLIFPQLTSLNLKLNGCSLYSLQSAEVYDVVKVFGIIGLESSAYRAIDEKMRLIISSMLAAMPKARQKAIQAFSQGANYAKEIRELLQREEASKKSGHNDAGPKKPGEETTVPQNPPKKCSQKDAFLGLWKFEKGIKEVACLLLNGLIPERLRPLLRQGGTGTNVLVETYLKAIKGK